MLEREEAEEITILMRMAQEIDFTRPDPVAGELNLRAKAAIRRGLLDEEMYQTLVDYISMRLTLRADDRERVKRHKELCRSDNTANSD
jgi:hypothetical protein